MNFLELTLAEDGRRILIRADLIQQIRKAPAGADVWLQNAVVTVKESFGHGSVVSLIHGSKLVG